MAGSTQKFCSEAMIGLPSALSGCLVKPSARIVVIGYYLILSAQSNFENEQQPRLLMESHGVATSSAVSGTTLDVGTLVPRIVENCMTFWTVSTEDSNRQ